MPASSHQAHVDHPDATDPPATSAVQRRSFQVRTQLDPAAREAVLDQVAATLDRAIGVSAAASRPSRRTLELSCGLTVRLVAESPRPTRYRPLGTLFVTVLVEGHRPYGDQERVETVLTLAQCVPFTALEQLELAEQMPLTSDLPTYLPKNCLSGIAPVLTAHHTRDFLVMVDSVRELGLPADAITMLDKGHSHRHTHRADAHLRAQGVRVWPWQEAAAALEDHVRRARRAGRQGLLVDDGGYTLPILIEQHPELLPEFVGLVEQTTSGVTKLDPYGDTLPLPIFSVAQSRLKAAIEPYGIAEAATRNLNALLPQEKWEGQAALVLGFGRIGTQLAELLRQQRMRVAVHDRSTAALVTAMERGFETGPDLSSLLERHQPLLIVGSTGTTSLRGEHAPALRRDCYLVSTSRDHEFALEELRAAAVEEEDAGQIGFRLRLSHKTQVTVVDDGHPVNSHQAESLSNKYTDPILASLVIGAATLAHPDHGFVVGHNVRRTNKTLTDCGLLERYYAAHGTEHATGRGGTA